MRVGTNGIAILGDSTIVNNGTGLFTFGGGEIRSFGNNQIAGNGTDGNPTSTIAQK